MRRTEAISWIGIIALAMPLFALAAEEPHDMHAAHREAMKSKTASVRQVDYEVPDVTLLDEDENPVYLKDILAANRPVAINFIFTTCTTICPVMTATMLQLQSELADDASQPAYVSISIDPDYDTAAVMKRYAARYGANWTFLTGASADVTRVLQAFDAYRGSKVNHFALTLMRPAGEAQWTRVEGLTSAEALAGIWRDLDT